MSNAGLGKDMVERLWVNRERMQMYPKATIATGDATVWGVSEEASYIFAFNQGEAEEIISMRGTPHLKIPSWLASLKQATDAGTLEIHLRNNQAGNHK